MTGHGGEQHLKGVGQSMNAISNIGISQQQYISQQQNLSIKSSASEEASETPAQKAAEANGITGNTLNVYA